MTLAKLNIYVSNAVCAGTYLRLVNRRDLIFACLRFFSITFIFISSHDTYSISLGLHKLTFMTFLIIFFL